jgi:hypothetical protein
MSDEAYDYYEDTKEKKFTARSARNKKGHTGKMGAMRTAADYMTQKQLRALNGECKTYRLGAPMTWEEFSGMPDDLKVMYIKKVRKEYFVPDDILASSMGVEHDTFRATIISLKLSPRKEPDYKDTDDYERFVNWWVVDKEE